MSRAKLFTPLRVGALELANRIVIAPMCQYSAQDGCMTDWHLIHLGNLALSGAAILIIEATGVTPEGRITAGDVGLYDDRCEAAMRQVLEFRPALVGHADRHPARARRAKGLDQGAVEGRRADRAGPAGRLADRSAFGDPVSGGGEPARGAGSRWARACA